MFCERWRQVPGAPRYDVSSLGRVRSRVRPGAPVILAQMRNRWGYCHVKLYVGGGRVWQPYVHRLVALAFIGPAPADGYVVDHVDVGPACNALSNLRWRPEDENRWDWRRAA